ncbi:MAG: hypothetical protein ACJ76P_13810 [Actinomycetota bacterium]
MLAVARLLRTGLTALLAVLLLAPAAAAATLQWTDQFGTPKGDAATSVALGVGGIYVAGRAGADLPGVSGAGGSDAFVRKYGADGTALWTREFGTTDRDGAAGVATDSSGAYVVGTTAGEFDGQTTQGLHDGFVRKYSPTGTLLWTQQFGTSGEDAVHGVAVTADGVFVVGDTYATFDGQSPHGLLDAYVISFTTSGTLRWLRQFGTSAGDDGSAIAGDGSAVYVSGETKGAFPGRINNGGGDAYVRKINSNGSTAWTRQFGTTGTDTGMGVAVNGSSVFVTGSTGGTFLHQEAVGGGDSYVRRYTTSGGTGWTNQFGTDQRDDATAIAASAGGEWVTGTTLGKFDGASKVGKADAFLVELSAGAVLSSADQFGSTDNDTGTGVAVSGSSSFVSGKTKGTLEGETHAGHSDAFAVRID